VPRVTPGRQDRYEPLPGLLEIPGFLLRKIPPYARLPAAVGGVILLAGLAVALVLAIPAITESKDERAADEARAEREQEAQRAAQLQAELRLQEGRGPAARGLTGAQALEARQALAAQLVADVEADAENRVQAGEFTQSVSRVECERFPRRVRNRDPALDLGRNTGRYSCLAVTADAPRSATQNPSTIGYPYRALLHFGSGRYAFCKITGRPGEGGLTRELPVRVPRACGGSG
jgi:hypothetical protein